MDLYNYIYHIHESYIYIYIFTYIYIYHDLVYHEPINLSQSLRSHLAPPDPLRDRLGHHKGRRGVERGQASLEPWENTVENVWKTMRKPWRMCGKPREDIRTYIYIYHHIPWIDGDGDD